MMYGREGSQRTYGEIGILALQYTDIDWTNKEIVINKAISKTKMSDGVRKWEWQIGPPKSRKSNRRVALLTQSWNCCGAFVPRQRIFPG